MFWEKKQLRLQPGPRLNILPPVVALINKLHNAPQAE